MVAAEEQGVRDGRLKPAGGHDTWLRTYPWILISELNDLIESGNEAEHEDRFARISLRFLGIDDARASKLIERARVLVADCGLPARTETVRRKSGKRQADPS